MKANDVRSTSRRTRGTILAICGTAALGLGVVSFGAGCGGGSNGVVNQVPGGGAGGQFTRAVKGKATVTHVTIEGGFYGLVTDTGERLLPIQMSSEFRQDGLRVRYDGAADDNQISVYQWGTPVSYTHLTLPTKRIV